MATRTNKLLWWALCVSQIIYIGVAYSKPPSDNPLDVTDAMFPALLFVAATIAAGTIFWRRRALVEPIQSGELDLGTTDGLAKAFTPYILNLALPEAVGIYGLVLSFLSNDPLYTIGFVAASLTLMWIHRPTSDQLQTPASLRRLAKNPSPIR